MRACVGNHCRCEYTYCAIITRKTHPISDSGWPPKPDQSSRASYQTHLESQMRVLESQLRLVQRVRSDYVYIIHILCGYIPFREADQSSRESDQTHIESQIKVCMHHIYYVWIYTQLRVCIQYIYIYIYVYYVLIYTMQRGISEFQRVRADSSRESDQSIYTLLYIQYVLIYTIQRVRSDQIRSGQRGNQME